MSEEPKNSAAPSSKEPITKAALEALGLKHPLSSNFGSALPLPGSR